MGWQQRGDYLRSLLHDPSPWVSPRDFSVISSNASQSSVESSEGQGLSKGCRLEAWGL